MKREPWIRYCWKATFVVEWEILQSSVPGRTGQKGTEQRTWTDRRLYKSPEAAQQALPLAKERGAKSQSGPIASDNPTWTLEELRNE
jgi:hypothetical protein